MEAANAAIEEQQRQRELEDVAAATTGDAVACVSSEQLAEEARGLLMVAIAAEVKAVRADVQTVVRLLREMKRALALAQQPDLPHETATELQQVCAACSLP
jgi:hypothetical protein